MLSRLKWCKRMVKFLLKQIQLLEKQQQFSLKIVSQTDQSWETSKPVLAGLNSFCCQQRLQLCIKERPLKLPQMSDWAPNIHWPQNLACLQVLNDKITTAGKWHSTLSFLSQFLFIFWRLSLKDFFFSFWQSFHKMKKRVFPNSASPWYKSDVWRLQRKIVAARERHFPVREGEMWWEYSERDSLMFRPLYQKSGFYIQLCPHQSMFGHGLLHWHILSHYCRNMRCQENAFWKWCS